MMMKTLVHAAAAGVAAAMLGTAALATPPVTKVTLECNWGQLTMEQIQNGHEQGEHASDPEGDGRGNTGRRTGLANVLEQGNMQETCEFIEMLLDGY